LFLLLLFNFILIHFFIYVFIYITLKKSALTISLYHIMESYIKLFELSFFNEFKEKIFTIILRDLRLLHTLDDKNNIIIEVIILINNENK